MKMNAAQTLIQRFFTGNMLSMPRRRPAQTAFSNYTPSINRWTGAPHEHKREIARHQRQAHIAAGTHAWRGRKVA